MGADEGQGAAKRAPARNTAATLGDLQVLWGGRDRLLRVGEVAEQLAVGAWAVYQMCENGELPQPMTMSDPPGVRGAVGRITAA